MSQQPTNKYEQRLRDEKIKYLLPHLQEDSKVLDIGGGDGSCWDSIDYRYTVDLLDFDKDLADKSTYYRNIFISNIDDDDIDSRCSKYDVVCLMGVLEHIEDPVALLQSAGKCASTIFITVPNAESFHRHLGVQLGYIDDIHDLDSQDIEIGHKRVYDKNMIYKNIVDSKIKFIIKDFGTSSFKVGTSSFMHNSFFGEEFDAINRSAILSQISGHNRFAGAEIFAVLKRYEDD
jgi:hypothetical protein